MGRGSDWLYEISFMRPVLLVLLVGYHAFAPFCGAWETPIDVCQEFYGGGISGLLCFRGLLGLKPLCLYLDMFLLCKLSRKISLLP